MSREAVGELIEKARIDEALGRALESALSGSAQPVQEFLRVAREHGCDFTAEEFVQVVEGMGTGDDAPRELSDTELDSLAAGGGLWSSTALKTFRSYTSSPSIQKIGFGGIYQQEGIEEDEMPM